SHLGTQETSQVVTCNRDGMRPVLLPSLSLLYRSRYLNSFPTRSRTMTTHVAIDPLRPLNQRVSIGPDGKVNVDLTFVEEPLGLPSKDGYGWPQIEFNQHLGPDNRYVVSR